MRTYEIRLPELPYKCKWCGRPSETEECGYCAIASLLPAKVLRKIASAQVRNEKDAAKQRIQA